jgi:hypothetical protein
MAVTLGLALKSLRRPTKSVDLPCCRALIAGRWWSPELLFSLGAASSPLPYLAAQRSSRESFRCAAFTAASRSRPPSATSALLCADSSFCAAASTCSAFSKGIQA